MGLTKTALFQLFVIFVCFLGAIQIFNKSGLPFQYFYSSDSIFISSTGKDYKPGDILFAVNKVPVTGMESVEFLMDSFRPGDAVNIQIKNNNIYRGVTVIAERYYSTVYVIISILTGLSFLITGMVVFYKGKNQKAARIYHQVSLAVAITVFCTWGSYSSLPLSLGALVRIVFHFGYTFSPVLFFYFALSFPLDNTQKFRKHIKTISIAASIISIALSIAYIYALLKADSRSIELYIDVYNVLRLFVLGGILSSVSVFAVNYFTSQNPAETKKLKWLLLGFITGPVSYVFLWIIPQAFQVMFVPEYVVLILMVAVPLTFSISIIKYHLLDIDLLLNRSIVYSMVIVVLSGVYFGLIYIMTIFMNSWYREFSSVISAFASVLIYQPLRKGVQKFVDKKFFRVQYDFRKALNKFFADIRELNDLNAIGEVSLNEINQLIPMKEFALVVFNERGDFIFPGIKDSSSFDLNKLYLMKQLLADEVKPAACHDQVEKEIGYKMINEHCRLNNIAMVYPLQSNEKNLLGMMLIGEKKSEQRFSVEDSDLFGAIAARISLAIERILLQRQLITELLEKEKFAELDKLKSFFISGVSHELKTPITTIKMYAEIMQNALTRMPEESEYFRIIDGECDRLARLIDNLLDISRIERGERKFRNDNCTASELVNSSLKIAEYLRKTESCVIELKQPEEEITFTGDSDSLISAFVNLLTNGIKYSSHPKKLIVEYGTRNNSVFFSVTDNGPGIKSEDIDSLVNPYFRTDSVKQQNISGMGIGLALVRHIMDGHKGKLEIHSSDAGACFTLLLPLENYSIRETHNEKSTVS